jgi:hypothetical protein
VKSQPDGAGLSGGDGELVVGRRLCPGSSGIDRVAAAVDDIAVDPVLHVRRSVGRSEEPLRIGLVLGEEQIARTLTGEEPLAQLGIRGGDRTGSRLSEHRSRRIAAPRPGVAEPQRRQQVQVGFFRTAIVHGDLNQEIFRRGLGVFDEHVEVAVLAEDAGVEQLVFEILPAAATVGLDEIVIGIGRLRVLVEILHVRVGRR